IVDVPREPQGASEGERLRRLTEERAGGRRPRYDDDDDDRPRRRRKSSGTATLLWILLGGAVVLLLVCGGGIYMIVRFFDPGHDDASAGLRVHATVQPSTTTPQVCARPPFSRPTSSSRGYTAPPPARSLPTSRPTRTTAASTPR